MAEMTGPERIAELERQLKRLRAAVASVRLVGGTEDDVAQAVADGHAEVEATMSSMADRNRQLLDEYRAAAHA